MLYHIEYWDCANWDGDCDVLELECDHVPTIQDVEKELGVGVQSMRPPVQIIPEEKS